eukprot:scaffold9860_cov145-Skeletonema_menzelii.AAC.5
MMKGSVVMMKRLTFSSAKLKLLLPSPRRRGILLLHLSLPLLRSKKKRAQAPGILSCLGNDAQAQIYYVRVRKYNRVELISSRYRMELDLDLR